MKRRIYHWPSRSAWHARVRAAYLAGRRRAPAVVSVGHPAHTWLSAPAEHPLHDLASRTDVLVGLLLALGDEESVAVWLTRPGEQVPTSLDAAWAAATLMASREVSRRCEFFVVTRHSWTHLASGDGRRWRRLRA
ncbi:MAG: hypothetical protein V9G04_06130 [Nocardioides sp.]|jgi:hypothetical protein